MSSDLVSIVIPTYNRAHFLPETLESISLQTYQNWECIIVDDGSTDKTEELVNKLINSDSRFSFYKRPASILKGANSCRNYGFEKAKGNYIQWFDSDDIMLPDHLEDLVGLIKKSELDFVVGDSVNFNSETGEELGKPYSIDRNLKIDATNFATQQIGWITDDFLAKKESIGSMRFNTHILTDGDEYNFFTRYLFQTKKGEFLDKILTKHRLHETSLSSPYQYPEDKRLMKVSKVKLLTYMDIMRYKDQYLNEWFLRGYILNSYFLALEGGWPFKFLEALVYIVRVLSLPRALSFLMSILSAKFFRKGYFLLQLARK